MDVAQHPSTSALSAPGNVLHSHLVAPHELQHPLRDGVHKGRHAAGGCRHRQAGEPPEALSELCLSQASGIRQLISLPPDPRALPCTHTVHNRCYSLSEAVHAAMHSRMYPCLPWFAHHGQDRCISAACAAAVMPLRAIALACCQARLAACALTRLCPHYAAPLHPLQVRLYSLEELASGQQAGAQPAAVLRMPSKISCASWSPDAEGVITIGDYDGGLSQVRGAERGKGRRGALVLAVLRESAWRSKCSTESAASMRQQL
jgi:hypothetical protein